MTLTQQRDEQIFTWNHCRDELPPRKSETSAHVPFGGTTLNDYEPVFICSEAAVLQGKKKRSLDPAQSQQLVTRTLVV